MTTTAALVAVVVLLSIGWLAAELRWSTERAVSARLDAEVREWAAEAAALRATQAAREEWGRQLRHEMVAHVSPVLQRAGEQNDRIPGLLARVAGEDDGLRHPEPGDRH